MKEDQARRQRGTLLVEAACAGLLVRDVGLLRDGFSTGSGAARPCWMSRRAFLKRLGISGGAITAVPAVASPGGSSISPPSTREPLRIPCIDY